MDSPTPQEARDAALRLDGHPLDMRIVDRFIDEHGPKMKDMTHDEQNDLADAIAKAPWNDPDYLPVHKDVVAALRERLNEARRLLDGANPQTEEQ